MDRNTIQESDQKLRARNADPADYTTRKLDVQWKLKVGEQYIYYGPHPFFRGQRVRVVGHESRGGIHIELGTERLTCSPFSLLVNGLTPCQHIPRDVEIDAVRMRTEAE